MRAIVTGGLGFIGSNLAHRLMRDGHDVLVFDNASRPGVLHNLRWLEERHGRRFRWVRGDTRDFPAVCEAIQGAAVIFHLAGQVAVTTSVANPQEDFAVNAQGTLNVLEAARRQRPAPVVLYTSTNKVYGGMETVPIVQQETRYAMPDYPDGIPETFPLDFHSPYGCSKGAADQYVHDYFRIYGVPTVVLRMSCIYGQRQFGNEDQGWVAHFVLNTLQGKPLTIYGDGKQVRDLLHIDDLVEAMLLAVARIDRVAGRVYNIGGGVANSVSVWNECSRHLTHLLPDLPPVTFSAWRAGDQFVYVSDIRKASEELDWQPRISVPEGLRRLVAWGEEAVSLLEKVSQVRL
jgi:CDP-paratose 2-epimerase